MSQLEQRCAERPYLQNTSRHSHGLGVASVTASLGVATFVEHGATADNVVQSADAPLSCAKASGRDRLMEAAT